MPTTARVAAIVVLFAVCPRMAAATDVVVVVSADSPLIALSKNQVADIFLGRTRTFPDGRRAEPVDLPESSAPHETFYAEFTGRNASQLKAYWSKIIFTGRGQPPKQLADIGRVKQALQGNPDAIAYLPPEAVDPGLRIVQTQ